MLLLLQPQDLQGLLKHTGTILSLFDIQSYPIYLCFKRFLNTILGKYVLDRFGMSWIDLQRYAWRINCFELEASCCVDPHDKLKESHRGKREGNMSGTLNGSFAAGVVQHTDLSTASFFKMELQSSHQQELELRIPFKRLCLKTLCRWSLPVRHPVQVEHRPNKGGFGDEIWNLEAVYWR